MTIAKRFALTLAITFILLANGQAQTPRMATVNISPDSDKVHISAIGDVYEMRIDVADESGDVVFQSGAITGQQLDWHMKDTQGERVAAGTYLVTVTFRNAAGKLRKRVEQVTVEESEEQSTTEAVAAAPNAVQAAITGAGTTGKIAKFTGAATIGNSVMTESAAKGIGININPTAVLQVHELPPATSTVANGANAATLLQTSGGKGGNTTAAGKKGGIGADISLLAGSGGNAAANGINGNGGSITLQPGSVGAGGTGGTAGNVLITPTIGNVGIGTNSPTSKLTVTGGDIEIKTANTGIKFADGSVQRTAGLTAVAHNTTLAGDGSVASPLSLPVPLSLSGSNAVAILSVTNTGSGPAISATGAINASTQYNLEGEHILSAPGDSNTFVGFDISSVNTGSDNSFFGDEAGDDNETGSRNSFFGSNAGDDNKAGDNNSFFGKFAGRSNISGDNNSFFGKDAGNTNTIGVENTVIGSLANVGANNLQNATAIGANALVTQNNSLVLGSIKDVNTAIADTNVGIGITAPSARLHVAGASSAVTTPIAILQSSGTHVPLAFRNGVTERARIRADSVGNLVFATLVGSAKDIHFRAGNDVDTDLFIKSSNGNVGIGTTTPAQKLHVEGNIRLDALGADGGTPLCRNGINVISTCSSSASSIHYKEQQAQITAQEAQIKQQQEQIEALKRLVCQDHPRAEVCE